MLCTQQLEWVMRSSANCTVCSTYSTVNIYFCVFEWLVHTCTCVYVTKVVFRPLQKYYGILHWYRILASGIQQKTPAQLQSACSACDQMLVFLHGHQYTCLSCYSIDTAELSFIYYIYYTDHRITNIYDTSITPCCGTSFY